MTLDQKMDDMPTDLRDLYAQFGRTAEMAQVMELEAGNLALAYVGLAFDPANITSGDREFIRAIVDDVNRQTFGNLLRKIRQIGEVSDEIEATIDTALEWRNYLVHKFFRTHNFAINSEEGRKEMSEELDQIYESLSRALAVFSGMMHILNEAFGRPNISEGEALELSIKKKRIKI